MCFVMMGRAFGSLGFYISRCSFQLSRIKILVAQDRLSTTLSYWRFRDPEGRTYAEDVGLSFFCLTLLILLVHYYMISQNHLVL